MSVPLLKIGVVLSTMIMISNWTSRTLPELVGLSPPRARAGSTERIISDKLWEDFGSAQNRCVCSISGNTGSFRTLSVCSRDPRHRWLQQMEEQVLNISAHLELLNRRLSGDLQRLKDSEALLLSLEETLSTAPSPSRLQELRRSLSQCRPLLALLSVLRADFLQRDSLKMELVKIRSSLELLQDQFSFQHFLRLQERQAELQEELRSCHGRLGCGRLTFISAPITIRSSGSRFGSWMMETMIDSSDERVWVMEGFLNARRLLEFQSLHDFSEGLNVSVHHLPHPWAGTGHVILNGSLYYSAQGSSDLLRVSLSSLLVLTRRPLSGAGFGNSFPFSWGGSTDVDLMSDGFDLWSVYSGLSHGGSMILSRMHPLTLEVLDSWDTGFPKRGAGEAFLICGTLYVTDTHLSGARVHFSFHAHGHSGRYEYMDLPIHNQYWHISMLDYNPRRRALLAWNNGHQVMYYTTLTHFIHTDPQHGWSNSTRV